MSQAHLDLTIQYCYLTQGDKSNWSAEMFTYLANDRVSHASSGFLSVAKSTVLAEIPVAKHNRSKQG